MNEPEHHEATRRANEGSERQTNTRRTNNMAEDDKCKCGHTKLSHINHKFNCIASLGHGRQCRCQSFTPATGEEGVKLKAEDCCLSYSEMQDQLTALRRENEQCRCDLAAAVKSVLEIRDILNPNGNLSIKDALPVYQAHMRAQGSVLARAECADEIKQLEQERDTLTRRCAELEAWINESQDKGHKDDCEIIYTEGRKKECTCGLSALLRKDGV